MQKTLFDFHWLPSNNIALSPKLYTLSLTTISLQKGLVLLYSDFSKMKIAQKSIFIES